MLIRTTKTAGPDDWPIFDRDFKYVTHVSGTTSVKEVQLYAKSVLGLTAPIIGRTKRQDDVAALAWAAS